MCCAGAFDMYRGGTFSFAVFHADVPITLPPRSDGVLFALMYLTCVRCERRAKLRRRGEGHGREWALKERHSHVRVIITGLR